MALVLTVEGILRMLGDRMLWDHTLVCRPENEAVVTEATERLGITGIRIRPSRYCPAETVFLIDDDQMDQIIGKAWQSIPWRSPASAQEG